VSLDRFARRLGDGFTIEFPRGSGRQWSLKQVTRELVTRLVGIFLPDVSGARPVWGSRSAPNSSWDEALLFHEYFHGDDGRGLGASHQTGWTGLVADLVIRRSREREEDSA
jgi:hypothetical protein